MADHHEPYNMHPFRRAVLRGLGLVLPPLLTVVILLWIGSSVQRFILNPVEWASRQGIVWFLNETKKQIPKQANVLNPEVANVVEAEQQDATGPDPSATRSDLQRLAQAIERIERQLNDSDTVTAPRRRASERRFEYEDTVYVQLENGEWIPQHIRDAVVRNVQASGVSLQNASGKGYYNHYVEHQILKRQFVIPFFLAGFILMMYLLGKFLAAGVGRYFWNSLEGVISQLPIIRTVYSSVKQVTDFFVGESDMDFKRVVAVEYPRRDIWSIGFVTGESLLTIRGAAQNEPVVSVLMPTSPVPGTGFTITLRKSETIDLDIPIEQALQFVVSCGVVIPDGELQDQITAKIQSATGDRSSALALEP